MSPPSSSPVRLSVVVSWTGSRSPRSPPVFPGNGSRPVAPPSLARVPVSPVPRGQRYYEGATTSCASPVAYLFRFRGPRDPPLFVLALAALPDGWRTRPGQAFGQPAAHLPAHSRSGASGISQVPRRSVPCLCPGPRPRPDRRSLTLTVSSMLPPFNPQRRLQRS